MSMNTVPERLAALRAAMKANGVDVYLIPVGDPHSSEYLPDHYTSLTYFSGFHGENSNFVVTMTESAVWADGRYFVQAEKEIAGTEIQLMRMGEPGVPTAEEYCGKVLPEGGTLGLCGLTANCALVNNLKKELESKHGSIKTLFHVLIWHKASKNRLFIISKIPTGNILMLSRKAFEKIGRASCRERV